MRAEQGARQSVFMMISIKKIMLVKLGLSSEHIFRGVESDISSLLSYTKQIQEATSSRESMSLHIFDNSFLGSMRKILLQL